MRQHTYTNTYTNTKTNTNTNTKTNTNTNTKTNTNTCSEQHLELLKWNVSYVQNKTSPENSRVALLSSEWTEVRLIWLKKLVEKANG